MKNRLGNGTREAARAFPMPANRIPSMLMTHGSSDTGNPCLKTTECSAEGHVDPLASIRPQSGNEPIYAA